MMLTLCLPTGQENRTEDRRLKTGVGRFTFGIQSIPDAPSARRSILAAPGRARPARKPEIPESPKTLFCAHTAPGGTTSHFWKTPPISARISI